MDDAGLGVVGIELDDVRFAVVDPDDAVEVAHGTAFRFEPSLYCRAPHAGPYRHCSSAVIALDQWTALPRDSASARKGSASECGER
jgi:hypothetical protein